MEKSIICDWHFKKAIFKNMNEDTHLIAKNSWYGILFLMIASYKKKKNLN